MASAKAGKSGGGKRKRDESTVGDEDAQVPEGKKAAKTGVKAEDEHERAEQQALYVDALDGIRHNEVVMIDTRLNFIYGLPKKARIAPSPEKWRTVQNVQGRLTNNYCQIEIPSIKINGPLTLVDIQPIRMDNNNFRFLKANEIEPKVKSLPRSVLLGTPSSIARHPMFGGLANFLDQTFNTTTTTAQATDTVAQDPAEEDASSTTRGSKKPTLQQEWICWVRDPEGRHYPMTIATFAHLYRSGRMESITLQSPSGWVMFCDEDRMFVVPRDFCPQIQPTAEQKQDPRASAPSATTTDGMVTPAVRLSKGAAALLPELAPVPPPPLEKVQPLPDKTE